MRLTESNQYNCNRVLVEPKDKDPDTIMEFAEEHGAIYYEEPVNILDDKTYVVILRPNIGPELWTERALRKSIEERRRK